MILINSKERSRFLKFATVGAIGAVIDFSIFNLLTSLFQFNPVVAQAISFSIAVTSNFIWNRYWTYPDSRSKSLSKQVIQFLIVNVIGLLIRTPLIAWLNPLLITIFTQFPLPFGISPIVIGHNIALAIAVGVIMLWNFFVNRFWTYSDVKSS